MLRKIVKGSLVTGLGIFLVSGFEYLYVIYAGNVLPPSEFGRLNTVIAMLAILLAMATAGIGTSIAKFVAERNDEDWQSSCISSGIILQIVIAILVTVLLLSFVPLLRYTVLEDLVDLLLVLAAAFPILTLAVSLPSGFLGLERIVSYNASMVINVAFRALSLFPLAYFYPGARQALLAFVVGGFAASLFSVVGLKSYLRKSKASYNWIKTLASYSIPVTVSSLLVILFVRADVVMLKLLADGDVNLIVAQYSAPAALARGIFYLSSAGAVVILPIVSGARRVPFASIVRLMLMLGGFHLVTIVVAGRFDAAIVQVLFPAELERLSYLLPAIVLAMAVLSLAHLVGTVLTASGRPWASAVAFLIGFGVFTVVSLVLIPERSGWVTGDTRMQGLGAEGVVIALIAGSAVAFIVGITWLIRVRSEPMKGSLGWSRTVTPMIEGGP